MRVMGKLLMAEMAAGVDRIKERLIYFTSGAPPSTHR